MSIDLAAANTNHYARTSFFSASTNSWTIIFWIKLDTNAGAGIYRDCWAMGEGFMSVGMFGSNMNFGTSLSDFTGTTALSTGVWYHMAWIRNGNTKTGYLNGVQELTGSDAVGGSITLQTQFNAGVSGVWDGAMAAVKIWDNVVLSVAEIIQEMRSYLPVRTDGLRGFYPFFNVGEDEIDYSGNAQTLTVTGTPATHIDSPPISWKADRSHRVYIAGAAPPPPKSFPPFRKQNNFYNRLKVA